MTRWTRPVTLGAMLLSLLGTSRLLASSGATSARAPGAPFCSLELSLFDRGPGSTYFLGSFTEDLVEATPGPVDPGARSGRADPRPSGEPVRGQRMRVTAAGGWGAETVHDARSRSDQEVVLVVWGYDTRCSLTRYDGSLPPGVPGEEALVVARLRDPDHWVGGLPTLDTFWGGLTVYPMESLTDGRASMEWERREGLTPPWERRPRLSAAEAFELMAMLPQPCEEVWAPLSFAAKSAVVTTRYPTDEREPLHEVLMSLEIRANTLERRRSACLADPRQVP